MDILKFYEGKNVFVTGHTGFKGSWLCEILLKAGANVTGYALHGGSGRTSLFDLCGLDKRINSIIGDIRDYDKLFNAFSQSSPDVVFHLAAQPLVRESYKNPRYTYDVNVMGTVNILECIRQTPCVKSALNVTTDKVYQNKERALGYKEDEPLDGFDPYSNSKSCSELACHSYNNSFFNGKIPVSTARSGNVIGGGDFAADRIIPDCVRAARKGEDVIIRNPNSIRPYQHVLEPLFAYLMIAAAQSTDFSYAGYYNIGPDDDECLTTKELAEVFCKAWGDNFSYKIQPQEDAPHEAQLLKLDCSKLKSVFNWKPRFTITEAVQKTAEWYKVWASGEAIKEITNKQIDDYLKNGGFKI